VSVPILIHVLSLDTVGGVEALYVHYLKEALSHGTALHYTCVSGKRPHPKFTEALSQYKHTPFLEQYAFGLRLPRFLRSIVNIRRGMVEGIVTPTAWVFWNRIEEKIPPGRSIYYEHGASWTLSPTKRRKQFLNHASSLIAVSEAARIMLQKRWDVSSPITVIPNPLRPDIRLVANPRTYAPTQHLRLGFAGRLVPIKGPLVPLHVLKQLHDEKIPSTLFIAGQGAEEHTMRSTAKHLGISSSVYFSGCVGNMQSWFDSIDILLVPSIREPLGLVALEAAARGVPVIAANVDGLAEVGSNILIDPTIPLNKADSLLADKEGLPELVVDPAKKDLVEPKILDPKTCASTILRLMNDSRLYETCSLEGLQKAQERSCFTTYYESLKSILENNPEVDSSV
jgi:glycosyltransferase involved in cell wall biosynthesis